jgi:hypothetical protein
MEDLKPETAIASVSDFKDGITPDVSKVGADIVQCTCRRKRVHNLPVKFLPMLNVLKPEV